MREFDDELTDLLAGMSPHHHRVRTANSLLNPGQGWSEKTREIVSLGQPIIATMPQLLAQTRIDLLRRQNFGRKCLASLEQALAKRGLHLADVSPPLREPNWWSGILGELV